MVGLPSHPGSVAAVVPVPVGRVFVVVEAPPGLPLDSSICGPGGAGDTAVAWDDAVSEPVEKGAPAAATDGRFVGVAPWSTTTAPSATTVTVAAAEMATKSDQPAECTKPVSRLAIAERPDRYPKDSKAKAESHLPARNISFSSFSSPDDSRLPTLLAEIESIAAISRLLWPWTNARVSTWRSRSLIWASAACTVWRWRADTNPPHRSWVETVEVPFSASSCLAGAWPPRDRRGSIARVPWTSHIRMAVDSGRGGTGLPFGVRSPSRSPEGADGALK